MPTTTLRTGNKMPLTGLGIWKVSKDVCAETVYSALKAGYRLLDGASDYGNEAEAGKGLKRAIDEGIVKREEVFVTSKLWNTYHAKENVLPALKRSLADWGLEYFDLYLIHFPIALKYVDPSVRRSPEWFYDPTAGAIEIEDSPISATWKELESGHRAGLIKDIGISNFSGALIMELLRYAEIKPSVLQIEHHPYLTQEPLVALCKGFDIAVTAFSSFGPQSWIELDHPKVKNLASLFTSSPIAAIAKAHNKTAAQVLLRWATQRGVAVIPKSTNPERLAQNLATDDFILEENEIKTISDLNVNSRFNDPAAFDPRISIFA